MKQLTLLFTCIFLLTCTQVIAQSEKMDQHDSSRWAKSIAAFEKEDLSKPPRQNGILFVGSSSIRMWSLDKSFPNMIATNRGFGGSQLADSVQYFDKLIMPHKPKMIVLYAGDNDINAGKSPERVFADFAEFVAIMSRHLPDTKLSYVAIKPSLKRWHLFPPMRRANALIESYCKQHPQLDYVDVVKPMLNSDGKPRPELFAKDGLHMNAAGYKIWTEILKQKL